MAESKYNSKYLHGKCDAYAVAFKRLFGGSVSAIFSSNDRPGDADDLIHAWVELGG